MAFQEHNTEFGGFDFCYNKRDISDLERANEALKASHALHINYAARRKMNTPRTKPLVRWDVKAYIEKLKKGRDGSYDLALTNPEFNQCIGEIITRWPHVEERMIGIFAELLGVTEHHVPMRQVFRSITSQHTRIKILRNLLQDTSQNTQKGIEYDQIIDEFSSLNDARNTYAHGLWSTHESGAVYLSDVEGEHYFSTERREVKIQELKDILARIKAFDFKALNFARQEMIKRLQSQASDKKQPQRPDNSTSALPAPKSETEDTVRD